MVATSYPYVGSSLSPSAGLRELSGGLGDFSGSNSSAASLGSAGVQGSLSSNRFHLAQSYSGGQLAAISAKSACQGGVPMAYGNDASDTYGSISPQFMLPSEEHHHGCPPILSQESFRDWNPTNSSTRAAHGVFFEHDSPSYGHSHLPFLNSSRPRVPSITADGSTFFPGLGSLSSSLPLASSSGDRILPKPQQGHLGCSGGSGGNDVGPSTSYSVWDGMGYKSIQQPWGNDSTISGASQESRRASSGSSSGPLGQSTSKSSASTSQDSPLAYPPISRSHAAQEAGSAGQPYSQNHSSAPATSQSSFPSSDMSNYPSLLCTSGTTLAPQEASTSLYSYSTGSSYKSGDQGGSAGSQEGTLVSGQQYTCLVHAQQPPPINSYGSLRRPSVETRPQSAHRSSLSGFRA